MVKVSGNRTNSVLCEMMRSRREPSVLSVSQLSVSGAAERVWILSRRSVSGSEGGLRIMWIGAEGELKIHLLSSIRSTRESRELTDVTSAILWTKCESLITR